MKAKIIQLTIPGYEPDKGGTHGRSSRRGLVLIMVMWVLFFLAVGTLTVAVKTRMNIRLRTLHDEIVRMSLLVQEGGQRAVALLAADDPSVDHLLEEWSEDFSLQKDTGLLSYKVIDEERFLNVNKAAEDTLRRIRQVIPGLAAEQLQEILAARPFNVLREVMDRAGIPPEFFDGDTATDRLGVRDIATVCSGGTININTASREVLLLVPDMNEAAADSVLGRRSGEPFAKREALSEELSRLGLTPAQVASLTKYTSVTSTCFRISAVAVSSRKHVRRTMEMVVRREGKTITVLSYRES